MGAPLGEGAFGLVMKAEASGINNKNGTTTVAVKMLKGMKQNIINHSTFHKYQ